MLGATLICMSAGALPQLNRANFIRGGAALLGAPIVGYEIYSRVPPLGDPSDALPPLPAITASTVSVVFPGFGGPDANTDRICKALEARGGQAICVDWTVARGSEGRAAVNADLVGRRVASELRAQNVAPTELHVVGVSIGGFAADALASAYKRERRGAFCRLTLCDPFTARGLPGLVRPATSHGVTEFGRDADVAVAVVNTDDAVPSTNTPLARCFNIDVTSAAAKTAEYTPLEGDEPGHAWPAAWFGMNSKAYADVFGATRHDDAMARGAVRRVA